MRLILSVVAVVALNLPGIAFANGPYTSARTYRYQSPSSSSNYSYGSTYSSSSNRFLYRGYNPGHVFGNTVRRIYWGPGMRPRR